MQRLPLAYGVETTAEAVQQQHFDRYGDTFKPRLVKIPSDMALVNPMADDSGMLWSMQPFLRSLYPGNLMRSSMISIPCLPNPTPIELTRKV